MTRPSRPASLRKASSRQASSRQASSRPPSKDERERSLDRIQEARLGVASRSLWLKRASVATVAFAIGVGALQEWPLLQLLAIPLALLLWWRDAGLTRADRRLERLYEGVSERTIPPPLIGEEGAAAAALPEPPDALRRALLSGPGVSIHLLMIAVALFFNLLG